MIALITGLIAEKKAPKLILDVNGVGYEIFVPLTIYETLPKVGEKHTLKICYVQKEDSTRLYGFNTHEEKDIFEMLCTVKGVGDKSVLKFLNAEHANTIRDCIANNDLDGIKRLPGLGIKTASKLLLDLTGKVIASSNVSVSMDQDAVNGLIALGYEEKVAKIEIQKVMKPKMKTKEIIQEVLKSK